MKDGKKVSWMNIADEGTSAHLKAVVHDVKRVAQIDLQSAIRSVNLCFKKWGLPRHIKIDNGQPFVNGNHKDVPTVAKLWWIELGIGVIQNTPCCPQENGVVECLQGTCYRWVNPKQIDSMEQLQKQLDQMSEFQRTTYQIPNRAYKTRVELYPELMKNPRVYQPESFSMDLVDQFLAQQVWQRQANQNGVISFFHHKIYLGRKFKQLKIYISFDPLERQWIFRNDKGLLLKTSNKAVPQEEQILDFASGA